MLNLSRGKRQENARFALLGLGKQGTFDLGNIIIKGNFQKKCRNFNIYVTRTYIVTENGFFYKKVLFN